MNETVREIALIEELHTAVGLTKLGLGVLQDIDESSNFYHLPLQLLASGKERLMKVILSADSKQRNSVYPTTDEMKNFGHDLEKLLLKVTNNNVWGKYWIANGEGAADHAFLTADEVYLKVIGILSHFGRFGRYSNLDIVAGATVPNTPEKDWQALELELLSSANISQLATREGREAARFKINSILVTKLERSLRALSRWFTLGGGSPLGRQYSGQVAPFLFLKNSDLGKTKWGYVGAYHLVS